MSAILYAMIHDRAKATYIGPEVKADNYNIWAEHWFTCARVLADEFKWAGMPATSKAFHDIIAEQKKFYTKPS